MVILNAIRGERVYLDTNIFIYALEGFPEFVDAIDEFFDSFDEGNLRAFTSELTVFGGSRQTFYGWERRKADSLSPGFAKF